MPKVMSRQRSSQMRQGSETPQADNPIISLMLNAVPASAKKFRSRRDGSVREVVVHQSHQRHRSGGLLCARRKFYASRCILPSHCGFTPPSRCVSLSFQMNTVVLWPTVNIRWNGFLGYALASGLQCDV